MASADDNTEITSSGSDVDQRIAFLVVVFSIVFFRISNLIVSKFIKPPPSAANDPLRWRNLFVSWIHAILCSCWDIICFTVYPEIFDDLSAHLNYFTYTLVAFSTGYFTYDSIDMYLTNRLLHDWGVTLHHLIVLTSFVYTIQTKYAIGLTCVALMVEVNGMFLHARKLMQIFQYGFEDMMYIVNKYVNLITFVIFRGYPIGRIFYGFLYECPAFTRPLRSVFICLIGIMAVINMVLFWRLCKSDIFLKQKLKCEDKNGYIKAGAQS